MKFGVKVMPRDVILDTQGRTTLQSLKENKFNIESCRIGKYLEIEIPTEQESEGIAQIQKMAEFVLYNPLIETYQIEKLK